MSKMKSGYEKLVPEYIKAITEVEDEKDHFEVTLKFVHDIEQLFFGSKSLYQDTRDLAGKIVKNVRNGDILQVITSTDRHLVAKDLYTGAEKVVFKGRCKLAEPFEEEK